MRLRFDNSAQNEDLTNFPVVVVLNTARVAYADFAAAAADLRFVDSNDADVLKHEIEEWNTNANSYVWVKVPQIAGSSSNDYIWMYWANPAASDAQDATNTWNADFKAVWHLKEDAAGTGTKAVYHDSTSNTNHGDDYVSSTGKTGRINAGQEFNGASDYIAVRDDPLHLYDDLTVEGWIRYDALVGVSALLRESHNGGYLLGYIDAGKPKAYVNTNATGTGWVSISPTAAITTGTWYHLAMTFDKSEKTLRYYVNAQFQGSNSTVSGIAYDPTDDLWMGHYASAYHDGLIDEVRISSVVRSPDWIRATCLSCQDNFVIYMSPQPYTPLGTVIIVQ